LIHWNVIQYIQQKAPFIKPCPCSPGTVSCGYFNMNLHTGCPYSCTYCILQAYLEHMNPVFFTNLGKLSEELSALSQSKKYLRIGTGELSDSLAFDHETGYSKKVLALFEGFPEVLFEFKTKSTRIKNLLAVTTVLKNIVISWSLNPETIAAREERGAPGTRDRLGAMKQVQGKGYKIGIHLDPLVWTWDWKILYSGLIKELADFLDPGRVAWISLGALRFPYSLRENIFKHRQSRLFEGELIRGYDDKYRYFKPLRLELFKTLAGQIRLLLSRDIPLYLCMEEEEAWQEVFPEIKPDSDEINKRLYLSALGGQ
jgi:spore photoproduct lyase